MRWQVELIFKVWKSTFGIEATRKMKFERFLCQLLAKLLLIMINWEIILAYRNGIYKREGRFLSIDKCFKTLKSNAHLFRDIINKPDCTAKQLIQRIGRTFAEKHWLEKRNNKVCYEEIINLVLWQSIYYAYIYERKREVPPSNNTSTLLNNKKFFEMSEVTKLNPARQTGGAKNHLIYSLLEP